MPIIAFLGCDGSGKSAVIGGVAEKLGNDGIQVVCGHWRPRISANGSSANAEDPHGQSPRGTLSSLLKLAWLWANWWGGWWRELRQASRHGVVLFDRYHGDLIVDPRRYRYGGPLWAARAASRLMPQPDLILFLDAEPAVLLSRKQEVSFEALENSRKKYLELMNDGRRCLVMDASRPLKEVVDEVVRQIGNLR